MQAPAPASAPPPRPIAGGAPRYYSLHREYGLAPDAPPPPPSTPRYVLIGPPDAPADNSDEAETPKKDRPS